MGYVTHHAVIPAARETAKDAIRQTVEIHFHGDIPPTEAMILRIKVG